MKFRSDAQRKAVFANMGRVSNSFAIDLESPMVAKMRRQRQFDSDVKNILKEQSVQKFIEEETGLPFDEAIKDPGVQDMYNSIMEKGSYIKYSPNIGTGARVVHVPKLNEE